MDELDLELGEWLIFELSTYVALEAFRDRFRPRWDGWSHSDEQMWLFSLWLENDADIAALLREAQELLREIDLPNVRFCLDGRVYALEAALPRTTADLAARSK
jgi:hypothetical protein